MLIDTANVDQPDQEVSHETKTKTCKCQNLDLGRQ